MKSEKEKYIISQVSNIASLMLLDLGAVKVSLTNPFKLVSGNYSPIYINCRQVISNLTFMNLFTAFTRLLHESFNIQADVVAGGETAGIPFAAFAAQSLSLPMAYIRKESKDYGIANLVEGNIPRGSTVLLIEDLITDAGSKMHFINAVNEIGSTVKEVLVVFDREQGGREVLNTHDIRLHAVTNMSTTLNAAQQTGLLTQEDIVSIHQYSVDPKGWHHINKLEYTQHEGA